MRRLKPKPLTIEDHVCGMCFARILSTVEDGVKVFLCPTCGRREPGLRPDVICSCGSTTPKGKNLGFRCVPNPEKTIECPFDIVARQI